MNNSNLDDEIKSKITNAIKKEIKEGKINFEPDFIDISDDSNIEVQNPKNNLETKNVSLNKQNIVNDDSSKDMKTKNSNFLDEVKGIASDSKNSSVKKNNFNSGSLENKNDFEKAMDKAKNVASGVKDTLQPAIDTAKQAANQLKEQGKNAAAKAGGAAITAATGGVVPPKLGEWASKKVLDKVEKDAGKKLQKVKEKASEVKEKIDNNENLQRAKSNVSKSVASTIKAVQFIKTVKMLAPIILGVIGFVSILGLTVGLIAVIQTYLPGSIGDVKKEAEIENYSSRDQKILSKIEKINKKYPNADATFVMSAVSYPYYELLQSDIINTTEKEDETEDEEEDFYDNILEKFENDDGSVDEADDEEETGNDMYLNLYSKKKYRDKYEKLMIVYNTQGKEGFETYLNETYFKEDSGYKKLLKKDESDDIKKLIISEIYDNSILFDRYVSSKKNCYTSYVSAGQVDVDEMLKGNILVDVKVDSCTGDMDDCESWYPYPISLSEYVKGVVWTEMSIDYNTDIEKIKAQMVAAKSYVLSRHKNKSYQLEDGSYVVPIRSNTYDQDYCDYNEGCHNKLSGNQHRAANSVEKIKLDVAWQDVADIYIVDGSNTPKGNYCASRSKTDYYDCSWCELGSCLSQTELTEYTSVSYKDILSEQYSSYAIVEIKGENATKQVASSNICPNNISNLNATRNRIVSFAQNYVGKIPYYENGLAVTSGLEGNGFGDETTDDGFGNTKKGLGYIGFVNWVYWSVIEDDLGNSNNLDNILSRGYEIQRDNLLLGDIGYSEDKTVVGIYAGDNNWIIEDKITGNVVLAPDDRITMFVRHNSFKNEMYNFTVRKEKPTPQEWNTDQIQYFMWPRNKYIGECVFYARNRALEIVQELYNNGSLTEKQYVEYSKRLRNNSGNADQFWYENLNGNTGTVWKAYTDNSRSIIIEDIKSGVIMGSTSDTAEGKIAGHIVIIEYANLEEDKIIVTDAGGNGTCSRKDFGCMRFYYREYTYAKFLEVYGTKFRGYLFFLNDN